jgi:hypothetical protein
MARQPCRHPSRTHGTKTTQSCQSEFDPRANARIARYERNAILQTLKLFSCAALTFLVAVERTERRIPMMPYYPARDGHPSMFTLDDNASAEGPIHSTSWVGEGYSLRSFQSNVPPVCNVAESLGNIATPATGLPALAFLAPWADWGRIPRGPRRTACQ